MMTLQALALPGLESEEYAELERILGAQRRQQARLDNRSQLIKRSGDVLRISARIHLLDAGLEGHLRHQMEALDDRIAVLKHCRSELVEAATMLATSREQRSRIAAQVDEGCRVVRLDFGPSLLGRQEPMLAALPDKLVRRARELSSELQLAAVRVVDDIVDGELLRLCRGRSADPEATALFRCADPSAETAARVIAFVEEIARLASIRDAAAERVRFEALLGCSGRSGSSIARQAVRAAEARAAMDSLRAMHAAIAEVELVCRA